MTQEFEIPEKYEVTLYTTLCLEDEYSHNIGDIRTFPFNQCNNINSAHLLLDERTITMDFSKVKIEGKQIVVDHLEKKKQDELANHHMKMKEYQDKIDSLLAITHEEDESNDT